MELQELCHRSQPPASCKRPRSWALCHQGPEGVPKAVVPLSGADLGDPVLGLNIVRVVDLLRRVHSRFKVLQKTALGGAFRVNVDLEGVVRLHVQRVQVIALVVLDLPGPGNGRAREKGRKRRFFAIVRDSYQ